MRLHDTIVTGLQIGTLAFLAGVLFRIGWDVGLKFSILLGITTPSAVYNILPGATIIHKPGDQLLTKTTDQGEVPVI